MKTNNFKFHFCPITVIIHPLNTGMLISDDEEEELTLKCCIHTKHFRGFYSYRTSSITKHSANIRNQCNY